MSKVRKAISVLLVFALLVGTVACLGGIVSIKAKADEPTYTDIDGDTTTPGQHGTILTTDELDAMYDSNWIYVSGKTYEFDSSDYTPASADFRDHLVETDGYVHSGDYVFVEVNTNASSQYNIGLPAVYVAHTYSFFENIYTTGSTAVQLATSETGNTDLETYGAIMNTDNDIVSGTGVTLAYKMATQSKTANSTTNVTKSGYTAAQLDTIGLNTYAAVRTGASAIYAPTSEWTLGILYKVKDGLADGTTGSIYLPAQDPDHSFWKFPGMEATAAGRKTANVPWCESGAAKTSAINLFTGSVDYSDFGATFVIGEAPTGPSSADSYTATFYDNDGTTVLGTVEDILPGKTVTADKVPEVADSEGKYFKGWSTVKGDDSAMVTFPQTINSDMSYFAIYSTKAPDTITLSTGDTTTTITAFAGDEITLPDVPSKTGYDALGWAKTEDAATPDVDATFTWAGTGDTTYYPVYKIKTFTVTFDANGGTSADAVAVTVDYGTAISTIVPSTNPTRDGYEFAGWATTKTATAAAADLGTVSKNITIYAVWTAKTYTLSIYMSEDAAEPYMTVSVTYGATLPTLGAADKPSAQASAPVNSAFASWVDKATGNTVSTLETRPAGQSGKYATASDLSVYATWTEVSTFSFYVDSGKDDGEWVLVGNYTKADWTAIASAAKAKTAELGYSYNFDAVNKKAAVSPKWYTNEECTEGVVYINGKDANDNTVSIVNDPITNTAYYLGGMKLSSTDVVYNGKSLLDSTSTQQYEGSTLAVSLDKIAALADAGTKFAGYFTDENGDKIETTVSTSSASFTLKAGTHTYTPVFEDIVYLVLFDISDTRMAQAEVKYGDVITLTSDSIKDYGVYTGFPTIPENIPDFSAEPEKSVDFYDYDLSDWGKAGYIATSWTVYREGKESAKLDNATSYTVNPDDAYLSSLGETAGRYVIKVSADITPLYYEATFACGEGEAFPDGTTEKSLWVAVDTGAAAIVSMTEAAFGTPVKENATFKNWVPNTKMPAEATTFTALIAGDPVKIYFVYEDLDGEEFSYEKLLNGDYSSYKVIDTYCGLDGSKIAQQGQDMVAPYNWAAYSVLDGWTCLSDYTYTDEDGNETVFVGSLADDNTITGNMVYVTSYVPFEDHLLIIYDSNTSYLIGSILEGIIDKERLINELFAKDGEEVEPGKIESLVGDYTGKTIEQVLSETLQKSNNENIYKTVTKKGLKTTYWSDGVKVSRKEATPNANSEEEIIITYQFKLINFNIKKVFSMDMWKHVYIAARPVTIPKSWLDPSQTATTIQTIVNVVKSFL